MKVTDVMTTNLVTARESTTGREIGHLQYGGHEQ